MPLKSPRASEDRPRERPRRGSQGLRARDGRTAALILLQKVLDDHRPLDEALAEVFAASVLAPREKAFARVLTASVLRHQPVLDRRLRSVLTKPGTTLVGALGQILRLGLVQLAVLGTPDHAAVSSSLALAEAAGLDKLKGLINGVLRRLAREGKPLEESPGARTPEWIWKRWYAAYGAEAAAGLEAAWLADPPLDLTLKDPAESDAWAERLGAETLPTGTLRRREGGGEVRQLPGFAEGAWWVQDAAAALPARLLPLAPDLRVLDLCAAPGGKTAQLAAASARVTALDQSGPRLEQLRENLERLGLAAEAVEADARSWRPETTFEAVLLDAPCTATGTLRRHPDIARLRRESALETLVPLQAELIDSAVESLAPGGTLVYAVCSLLPEEGAAQAEAALARHEALERWPIAADELPGVAPFVSQAGHLLTLPGPWAGQGHLDGFFACRFKKRA